MGDVGVAKHKVRAAKPGAGGGTPHNLAALALQRKHRAISAHSTEPPPF
jgi:hypothetical protein